MSGSGRGSPRSSKSRSSSTWNCARREEGGARCDGGGCGDDAGSACGEDGGGGWRCDGGGWRYDGGGWRYDGGGWRYDGGPACICAVGGTRYANGGGVSRRVYAEPDGGVSWPEGGAPAGASRRVYADPDGGVS